MPPDVIIRLPGVASTNPEFPDEVFWTFQAEVNGRSGLATGYFALGTSEEMAARQLHRTLMEDERQLEGMVSTGIGGGGGGGSSISGDTIGAAGTGETTGPTNPSKMKGEDEDEEDDGFGT